MLEVYGSKHSLLPRIWEVEAVGIGASSSELRTPCCAILLRRASQSHLEEGSGKVVCEGSVRSPKPSSIRAVCTQALLVSTTDQEPTSP